MTRHGSILLVDDEEKILKTLGRVLRDDGHEVVEAHRAREARELLARRSFDPARGRQPDAGDDGPRAEAAGGVKKDAAELMELMGISQRALSYYVAKYRLDAPPKS